MNVREVIVSRLCVLLICGSALDHAEPIMIFIIFDS